MATLKKVFSSEYQNVYDILDGDVKCHVCEEHVHGYVREVFDDGEYICLACDSDDGLFPRLSDDIRHACIEAWKKYNRKKRLDEIRETKELQDGR